LQLLSLHLLSLHLLSILLLHLLRLLLLRRRGLRLLLVRLLRGTRLVGLHAQQVRLELLRLLVLSVLVWRRALVIRDRRKAYLHRAVGGRRIRRDDLVALREVVDRERLPGLHVGGDVHDEHSCLLSRGRLSRSIELHLTLVSALKRT